MHDAFKEAPYGFCDELSSASVTVARGVVLKEADGAQSITVSSITGQLAEFFSGQSVGLYGGCGRMISCPHGAHVEGHEVCVAQQGFRLANVGTEPSLSNRVKMHALHEL